MRILVTGANGQLGNEMQMLAKENPQHLYYFTDVQELDICNKEAVWSYISEKQIDVIVNCAAYTAVDKAEDDRELAHKLNSVAPGILARAAQANNAAMIQVSTDYVFAVSYTHLGSGLRDSQQVDKVVLCNPFPFGYDFIFNQWHHRVSSSDGEGAYFKKDSK